MNKSKASEMGVPGEITKLLAGFQSGDPSATEKLASLVYGELRRIAVRQFRREQAGHSLRPTALVDEAFARMMTGKRPSVKDRAHFFAVAAKAMRRILIDHARKKKSDKRGGGEPLLELDDKFGYTDERSDQLISLDDALNTLETIEPRQSQIIVLKFFGGMTNGEVANAMGLGLTTVKAELNLAQAWLRREIQS